jgi:uncharacterized repeat protein (TIGR03803 family)
MKTTCALPAISTQPLRATAHAAMKVARVGTRPKLASIKPAAGLFRAVLVLAVLLSLPLAIYPAQAQTETVLHTFNPSTSVDGAQPEASLTFHDGNLYGTTETGGSLGYGVVFALSPNGSGGWNEAVLHEFSLGEITPGDGGFPTSNVIFDNAGNIYGTTMFGGPGNCGDCGTVFELTPSGMSWTFTTLYTFAGGSDGLHPQSGLIMDAVGNLYGTTSGGGANNTGAVFELSPSGSGWTEKVIYAPPTNDSIGMYAGLTMDAAGNLFGASGQTVFELSPNGSGGWNSTVLHTFLPGSALGFDAESTPVLDQSGNLYGTTAYGGVDNNGTVYKLANGTWQETVLYGGNKVTGGLLWGGVVLDAAGNIYGTAQTGGLDSGECLYTCGTVFELSPAGGGTYLQTTLFQFNFLDGANPMASLILDSAGKLYGTGESGGLLEAASGVVFEVNPAGQLAATETTLTSSPDPSTHGEGVTFTAVITSSQGAPPNGETVSFMKGGKVLGTGVLSGGSASFTTKTLKVGTTAVTAAYAGDSNFAASTSNTVQQVVNKAQKQAVTGCDLSTRCSPSWTLRTP